MEFECQKSAIEQLHQLAKSDKHSILISGVAGCGKSYLAAYYAKLLNISTYHKISPKVGDLKDMLENSYKLQDKQVICIENLDSGVSAAAQVILKYLEEPSPNVYVIVTCVNASTLPSTILSRSISVKINQPFFDDLSQFGNYLNSDKFKILASSSIKSCMKSFTDVLKFLNLTQDQFQYYETLKDSSFWLQPFDTLMWNLGHYPDNSKSDLSLVFRVIIESYDISTTLFKSALSALLDLENNKVSSNAILGKFVFDIKGI